MDISNKSKGIVDACRFCWMCRHVCPIGNATGLERNTARARALGCSLVTRKACDLSDVSTNIYECMMCGACTNNCKTGWDPKVFIEEFRTQLAINQKTPDYIEKLIEKTLDKGNPFGTLPKEVKPFLNKTSDTVLVVGQDALYNLPELVKDSYTLLEKAGIKVQIDEETSNTGFALYFLTGKTEETRKQMEKWARSVENKKLIIFYDPQDLALVSHKYAEWNISVKPKLISFNDFLLSLIKEGNLKVKKSNNEYTAHDNFAYSRELKNNLIYNLIDLVGKNKEILLKKEETNAAGHLIMSLYMGDVIDLVAKNRLVEATRQDVKTFVTESPSEYYFLKKHSKTIKVISVEQLILENLR